MRKIFKPFKSSKVIVTGMIVSLCFAFVGCSKAEQNKGSRSFTDFTHIEEEYLATLKSLDFPEGTVLPERLEEEDSEASFQEGYGEMRACNLWEYLWMQEWLDTYTTEPERAERALKELEKAFNMAYMPNKNRIVEEKEQCYNTKNNDRRLLDTSVVGGAKETMQNILVVEDDRELNEALCYALKKQDYHTSTAFSIQEAKETYQSFTGKEKLQLVIQDVNLPDGEGFTFCQWVKAQQDIPVLFLTARDLEEDVLKGYDLGAEDYITKPFSMKVLLRKIELIFKRTQPEQPGGYDDGYLKIDWEQAKVMVDQKACAVTPTEFRLLKVLAENQGRLLTYEILLEQLWDCDGQFVDKHTL